MIKKRSNGFYSISTCYNLILKRVGVVVTQGHYFIPVPTTAFVYLIDLKWFACGWALKWEAILIGSYQVGAIHGFWKWSDLAAILVLFTVRCLAQANIPLFSVCFLFPWLSHSCLFQSRWNSLGFSSLVPYHLPLLLKFLPSCWALNRKSLGWAEEEYLIHTMAC